MSTPSSSSVTEPTSPSRDRPDHGQDRKGDGEGELDDDAQEDGRGIEAVQQPGGDGTGDECQGETGRRSHGDEDGGEATVEGDGGGSTHRGDSCGVSGGAEVRGCASMCETPPYNRAIIL
jgi:hypothetical protein